MGSSAFYNITSSKCVLLGLSDEDNQASSIRHFFDNIWQKQPAIFRGCTDTSFGMNWVEISELLHHCRHEHMSSGTEPPLFFQNGNPIVDPDTLYASNPHAAFLDGCSIIINHADLHHKKIADLCNDLQETFPHVYANSYLTPSRAHAVKAHADDRDVLVMQILGKKMWRVYKKVPIEYPFDKEQVGKNGNKVASAVLEGGLCFNNKEVILCPGDVLYLPRGYVHEARCDSSPSFHITVALATHDWCLSTILSETVRQTLNEVPKFRRALPIGPCQEYESTSSADVSLEQHLHNAMAIIQTKINALVLEQNMRAKYQMHNSQVNVHRQKLLEQSKKRKNYSAECVGYDVASQLTLDTSIRVSTPEERSSVSIEEGCLRGLTVREETMQTLMSILGKIKANQDLTIKVHELRDLVENRDNETKKTGLLMVCDFTLLSFAKCCVELGALAVVEQ